MRKLLSVIIPVLLTTWALASETAGQPQTLTIAAANSLKEALRAIVPVFEREHPDAEIRIAWGPSQTLRDHIADGAPVDVFMPSSLEEIDTLERKGLTLAGTKQRYALTTLVLITQATFPVEVHSVGDLTRPEIRRIAIGNPKTSSVGKFAMQALSYAKLEGPLRPRLVLGEHSGAVLELVASGEADVGLVYRSDATRNSRIQILAGIPEEMHAPIIYGVAAVWTTQNPSLAQAFIDFLHSGKSQQILSTYGFTASGEPARRARQ